MSTDSNFSVNAPAAAEQGSKKRPRRRLLGASVAGLSVLAVVGIGSIAGAAGFE